MWREGLGLASILIENKHDYRNHPATKEFEKAPQVLLSRLGMLYLEAKKRGYKFDYKKLQPLIDYVGYVIHLEPDLKEWQTLEEQIEVIRNRHCKCKIWHPNNTLKNTP